MQLVPSRPLDPADGMEATQRDNQSLEAAKPCDAFRWFLGRFCQALRHVICIVPPHDVGRAAVNLGRYRRLLKRKLPCLCTGETAQPDRLAVAIVWRSRTQHAGWWRQKTSPRHGSLLRIRE